MFLGFPAVFVLLSHIVSPRARGDQALIAWADALAGHFLGHCGGHLAAICDHCALETVSMVDDFAMTVHRSPTGLALQLPCNDSAMHQLIDDLAFIIFLLHLREDLVGGDALNLFGRRHAECHSRHFQGRSDCPTAGLYVGSSEAEVREHCQDDAGFEVTERIGHECFLDRLMDNDCRLSYQV